MVLGPGGHIGNVDGNYNRLDPANRITVIGVDAIIGLDFTIPNAPINLQVDYKPGIHLVGWNEPWVDSFAVSIRYAIK